MVRIKSGLPEIHSRLLTSNCERTTLHFPNKMLPTFQVMLCSSLTLHIKPASQLTRVQGDFRCSRWSCCSTGTLPESSMSPQQDRAELWPSLLPFSPQPTCSCPVPCTTVPTTCPTPLTEYTQCEGK